MSKSSDRVTSRLIKRERKKLVRQTVYFGAVAVIIILLFIFVILPGFLSLLNKFLNTNLLEEADTLPPQIPIVSSPVAITSSASMTLDGYGEPESEVILVLNAIKYGSTAVSSEGQFSIDLKLEEGENTIELYSVDQAGNESNSTKTYVSILDTQNPDLEISEPQDGASFNGLGSRNIQVKGKTDPGNRVLINDRRIFASSDGSFSMAVELKEGENKIEVKSIDQANNESAQTISVTLKL